MLKKKFSTLENTGDACSQLLAGVTPFHWREECGNLSGTDKGSCQLLDIEASVGKLGQGRANGRLIPTSSPTNQRSSRQSETATLTFIFTPSSSGLSIRVLNDRKRVRMELKKASPSSLFP